MRLCRGDRSSAFVPAMLFRGGVLIRTGEYAAA